MLTSILLMPLNQAKFDVSKGTPITLLFEAKVLVYRCRKEYNTSVNTVRCDIASVNVGLYIITLIRPGTTFRGRSSE